MKFLKRALWLAFNWAVIYLLAEEAEFSPKSALELPQVLLFGAFFAINILFLLKQHLQYFVEKDSINFRDLKITPALFFLAGAFLLGAYFLKSTFWPLAGLFFLEFGVCICVMKRIKRIKAERDNLNAEKTSLSAQTVSSSEVKHSDSSVTSGTPIVPVSHCEDAQGVINRRKIWFGVFLGLTALLILVSIGMLQFALQVSSGSNYLHLIGNGVGADLAKQEALRIGHMSQLFYFFGLPFPLYLLINLLSAHFLRIRIKSHTIPLWKIMSLACIFGGTFFSLFLSMWRKSQISENIVGSFIIWLGIFFCFALVVAAGKFACWINRRRRTQKGLGNVTQ